jgi:hypothetical protein
MHLEYQSGELIRKVIGHPKDYSKQAVSRLWFLFQQGRDLKPKFLYKPKYGRRVRRVIGAAPKAPS